MAHLKPWRYTRKFNSIMAWDQYGGEADRHETRSAAVLSTTVNMNGVRYLVSTRGESQLGEEQPG